VKTRCRTKKARNGEDWGAACLQKEGLRKILIQKARKEKKVARMYEGGGGLLPDNKDGQSTREKSMVLTINISYVKKKYKGEKGKKQ